MTAESPVIEFDEVAHRYVVGGVERPSVTQVIYQAGLIDDRWWSEEARNRGKAVHIACHYLDEGDLDIESVDEAHRLYVRAWERFKADARFTPKLIEHRIFHPTYGYCGTLDRTGTIEGGATILLDIKTGLAERWHGIQLAGYANSFDKPGRFRRLTVLLRRDGTYKVHEYSATEYRDHWNTFRACLAISNFKQEARKHVRTRDDAADAA